MSCDESEDDVGAHGSHGVAGHLGDVAVVFDESDECAVDGCGEQKEQGDEDFDGIEEGVEGFDGWVAGFDDVAQWRGVEVTEQEDAEGGDGGDDHGDFEGAPFLAGWFFGRFDFDAGLAAIPGAEHGFDDFGGDECADDGDEDRAGEHEIVVGCSVDHVGRVDALGGLAGEGGEHGVEAGDEEVGAESAGNAGVCGSEAGDGVSSESCEEQCAEWCEDDVSGVGDHGAHDAGEDEGSGDEVGWDGADEQAQAHGNEAGSFGDADAEHDGEDGAQGSEVDEVFDGVEEHPADAFGAEEALDGFEFGGAGALHDFGFSTGKDGGGDDDHRGHDDEEGERVG